MEPKELYDLTELAQRGDRHAQFKLAQLYDVGSSGVPQSAEESGKWYRKAAEQGHFGAQKRVEAQNFRDLLKQAEDGDREAQYKLAREWEFGYQGDCENREEEATKWYRNAAEQGHVEAQFRLGRARIGDLAVDEKEAVRWLRIAANAGHVHALEDVRNDDELKTVMREIVSKTEEKEICDLMRKLPDHLAYELSIYLLGEKIPLDIVNSKTGEIIIPANRKITKPMLRKLASIYEHVGIDPSPIRDKIREIIDRFEPKFATAQSALEMCRCRRLDELMTALDNLIVDLNIQWRLHFELFQADKPGPLFEMSGSAVWGVLHGALIESIFMCVARLLDPPASCGNGNLSFEQVLKHLPQSGGQTQIKEGYTRIRGLYDPAVKRWRNWKLSHNSLKTLRGIDPLPDVSHSDLRTLIEDINQFAQSLGAIVRKTVKIYVPVASYAPVIPNQDWVRALIKVLEGGTDHMRSKP